MVLGHRAKIEAWARSLVSEYPALDMDDVMGEAWILALDSSKKWSPKGGASFSSYLHRRLHWLRLTLIDKHLKREKIERIFGQEAPQSATMDPGERVLVAAAQKLTKKERRLLNLLVCPPVEFVQRECCQGAQITSRSYARQLDCNEQTIWWYMSRIKHALSEVL